MSFRLFAAKLRHVKRCNAKRRDDATRKDKKTKQRHKTSKKTSSATRKDNFLSSFHLFTWRFIIFSSFAWRCFAANKRRTTWHKPRYFSVVKIIYFGRICVQIAPVPGHCILVIFVLLFIQDVHCMDDACTLKHPGN